MMMSAITVVRPRDGVIGSIGRHTDRNEMYWDRHAAHAACFSSLNGTHHEPQSGDLLLVLDLAGQHAYEYFGTGPPRPITVNEVLEVLDEIPF